MKTDQLIKKIVNSGNMPYQERVTLISKIITLSEHMDIVSWKPSSEFSVSVSGKVYVPVERNKVQ